MAFINFCTNSHNILVANNVPFQIKGCNWFGFEDNGRVLNGLFSTSMDSVLDFVCANKFNALRIPLAVTTLTSNPELYESSITHEPLLQGKRDLLVLKCAERKLLIMFDMHRLCPEKGISELWYDEDVSMQNLKDAWTLVCNRYRDSWNVFAADLLNEPHGSATWGSSKSSRFSLKSFFSKKQAAKPTDFRAAAEELGNHILSLVPRWLIFVEGINHGGSLEHALKYPVRLSDPSKLVYSPHCYGPEVYKADFFEVPDFPHNMAGIWDYSFGNVQRLTGVPIVIGEWGSKMIPDSIDRIWAYRFLAYIKDNGFGSFYWSVNPNSNDTGGLLLDDWLTPHQDKLDLLQSLPSTDVSALV